MRINDKTLNNFKSGTMRLFYSNLYKYAVQLDSSSRYKLPAFESIIPNIVPAAKMENCDLIPVLIDVVVGLIFPSEKTIYRSLFIDILFQIRFVIISEGDSGVEIDDP